MKIKIKRPILFGTAIILYFASTAVIWGYNNPDSFLYDLINKRDVADIVFFVCMGLGVLSVESPMDHPIMPKILAVVFFLTAIGNAVYLGLRLEGAFLPSGPAPEIDDFGNPVLPTIDGFEDLNNWLSQ